MIESRGSKVTSRDRRRQFTDIRQSHSRRKDISQSQLSKSVGKSRLNRSYLNDQKTSRLSCIENEESKVLKQSKQCLNSQGTKSHKNLVCVCCYNKKEAQYKQYRRNRQKIVEQQIEKQMKESMIQTNLHKQLLYESHARRNIQDMTEYNRKLTEMRQKQKYDELNQKMYDAERIRIQKENLELERQNRAKQTQQMKELLKQKYQEQMRLKEEKQNFHKQMNQSLDQNCILDAIMPNKQVDRSVIQTIRASYKQDLLRQIHQKQAKKKRQIQDYKGRSPAHQGSEFQLVTFAEKRNEQAKHIANQLKKNYLKDINQRKNQQKFSKQEKEAQRMEKQRERKQQISQIQAQRLQKEDIRRQKIDSYLSDLKNQIEHNKKKRLQQLQWINDRKNAEPIIKPKQVPEYAKDECNGCHKIYPKKMLSEFVTIDQS